MTKTRTIRAARPTPKLLADAYLLPMSRSGWSSGIVRWMPGRDVCAGEFAFDVCPLFALFQGRQDIEWHVTATASGWSRFNSWLSIAGRNSLMREQSLLYDALYGSGEILKPERFDCVTGRTPEISAVCEYGTPIIDCELRGRNSRHIWRQRVSQYVWAPWPLTNVRMAMVEDAP